ncbi:MAG TPA: hypothetical protein VGG75_30730 [Trebonia sp.]|jgi:hypothetical protein
MTVAAVETPIVPTLMTSFETFSRRSCFLSVWRATPSSAPIRRSGAPALVTGDWSARSCSRSATRCARASFIANTLSRRSAISALS